MQRDDDRAQRARRRNRIRELKGIADKILWNIQTGQAQQALFLYRQHTREFRIQVQELERLWRRNAEVMEAINADEPEDMDEIDNEIIAGIVKQKDLIAALTTYGQRSEYIDRQFPLYYQAMAQRDEEVRAEMRASNEDEDIESVFDAEMNAPPEQD